MFKLLVLLLATVLVLGSESPYRGKISLQPIEGYERDQSFYFTPLTEEPKIANFNHQQIELLSISEPDSCKTLLLQDPDSTPIFAVVNMSSLPKLTCSIMQKISNIRRAGFKGLLLVIDSTTFLKNHCTMYDDNHFFTGVMDSTQHSILLEYNLKGLEGDGQFLNKGLLSIELRNTQAKLLEVWVSSLNAESYVTLEYLNQAILKIPSIDKQIQWTPRFATLSCAHGQRASTCAQNGFISSCGCNGQFCSPQAREKTPVPLIQQDIRQLLIFKQYGTKYLHYAYLFAKTCLNKYQSQKYIEECATNIMDKMAISSESINSLVNDFISKCIDQAQVKESEIYTTLERDQRAFVSYGRYPLVLVNKEIIEFGDQDDFNGMVCSKLELLDQNCGLIVDVMHETTSTVSVVFFVLLVLILVAAAGAVVYFYRRKMKRDVNKEIKMQVSTAVEHYFALTDTTNK